MSIKEASSISQHFEDMPDPRTGDNTRYSLISIIMIAICGVIAGADSWVEVAQFGNAKRSWFERFLELPHGIPSHDTFGRIFRLLDPAAFEQRFYEWTQTICQLSEGTVVAIDGKQLRGSKETGLGKDGIYMVNAWVSENRVALAQRKVDEKSNEITAIPELLELLDLTGAIVTIDAMGCQTDIVETIQDQGADYVIAVKDNQGTLSQDVELAFQHVPPDVEMSYHKTINKGHGRVEVRECWACADTALLNYINDYKPWHGLQSVVKVVATRYRGEKVETNTRYYIASLQPNASHLLDTIRNHWGVENSLHWTLDVAFDEDHCRVRKDHAPQNLAVLRQLALNLLNCETSLSIGVKAKRKRAGWDENYLLKVLAAA